MRTMYELGDFVLSRDNNSYHEYVYKVTKVELQPNTNEVVYGLDIVLHRNTEYDSISRTCVGIIRKATVYDLIHMLNEKELGFFLKQITSNVGVSNKKVITAESINPDTNYSLFITNTLTSDIVSYIKKVISEGYNSSVKP